MYIDYRISKKKYIKIVRENDSLHHLHNKKKLINKKKIKMLFTRIGDCVKSF